MRTLAPDAKREMRAATVTEEALERLSRPGLWLLFALGFVALVALLLYLAQGAGAPVQRFDYDLF